MPDGSNLIIGQNNTGTATTELHRSGGTTTTAFNVDNDEGVAINASSRNNEAISGASELDNGVFGASSDAPGVQGESGTDPGVFGGSGRGVGVLGVSDETAGVSGVTFADDSAGVFAKVLTDSAGVWGQVAGGQGSWPGVEGFSSTANGVRGVSTGPGPNNNVGVVGFSKSGSGVVGITDSPTAGFSNWGGLFFGGLLVSGSKNSAVRHPDGSHRLLYCMESPESWFEDFGRATLVRGRSRVKLDPSFAAVVRTEDYHVFLCPEGDVKGLYVSRRNRVGFEVRENEGGKSSSTFSYRIVARRKDIKAPRFAKAVVPQLDTKELLKTPKAIEKIAKMEKRDSKTRRDAKRQSGRRTK